MAVSRFLLAYVGLLTTEHHGNDTSLLINSGLLGLTQSLLRLTGRWREGRKGYQVGLDHTVMYMFLGMTTLSQKKKKMNGNTSIQHRGIKRAMGMVKSAV